MRLVSGVLLRWSCNNQLQFRGFNSDSHIMLGPYYLHRNTTVTTVPPYHRTTVQRTQGQLWTTMETTFCCRDQQEVEGTLLHPNLPANGGTRVHVFFVQQKRNETGLVDRPSFLGSSAVKHAVAVSFSVASVASLLLPPTFAVASLFSFRVHPHPNAFSFAS